MATEDTCRPKLLYKGFDSVWILLLFFGELSQPVYAVYWIDRAPVVVNELKRRQNYNNYRQARPHLKCL